MATTLLLCGASVRAAAYSALRAGFQVWCADLFADADLRAICPDALQLTDSPLEIPEVLDRHAPPGPFLYTGGLENHPAVLDTIRQQRPVWGMTGDALRAVRDPITLQRVLAEGGFPTLEVRRTPPADSRRWLCKPLASGGGQHICFWERATSTELPTDGYWQEFHSGAAFSALYLGDGTTATLIGMTEQLIGVSWLHAVPFAYCGNIGPLPLTESEQHFLEKLGTHLTRHFQLCGLFGLDLLREGEQFFVTEINPRYTASVELYELASQVPLLAWHGTMFDKDRISPLAPVLRGEGLEVRGRTRGNLDRFATALEPLTPNPSPLRTGARGEKQARPCLGKAIYYAPRDLVITDQFQNYTPPELWQLPLYADLPCPGTTVRAGHPVLTLFVAEKAAATCRFRLEKAAYALDKLWHDA
jgi:predicted ATP-grasp superfamily ATP-dependent carboligase